MAERLFTTYQIADLLGQTLGTVMDWIRKGWLPVRRLPSGPIRVPERGLIRFLRQRGIDIEKLFARSFPDEENGDAADHENAPAEQHERTAVALKADAAAQEADAEGKEPLVTPQEAAALRGDTPLEEPGPTGDVPEAEVFRAGDAEDDAAEARREEAEAEVASQREGEEPEAETVQPGGGLETHGPAAQVAEAILEDAAASGADQMHLEPRRDGMALRLRVGGVLRERSNFKLRLPDSLAPRLIDHFKSLASLDVAERRRPQSGEMIRELAGRLLQLKVSTCPTVFGEKVFVGLKDTGARPGRLSDLAMPAEDQKRLRSILAGLGGMVIVAGQPRSGKAATLAALLNETVGGDRNAVSVGRSADVEIEGVNRSELDTLGGFSYAEAMRAFETQDADVIMIEDLRDPETAVAAVEAARGGRVVIAGMIAGNAAEAIRELLAMGVEPWPLASTLSAVVEQRREPRGDAAERRTTLAVTYIEGEVAAAIRASHTV